MAGSYEVMEVREAVSLSLSREIKAQTVLRRVVRMSMSLRCRANVLDVRPVDRRGETLSQG